MQERGPLTRAVGGPVYRLRPSIEPFVDRHGALCFVRPGDDDLVVREPDDADLALVGALQDGWDTVAGLTQRLGRDRSLIELKLDALVAAGLALMRSPDAPPLTGEDADRFARQLPYLAELGDEIRLQRQLRDATVVVIGCGGLGTWAIATLACIGVGRIVLVDDDHVALSNLNRQILYTRDDVGAAKVGAAARWIHAFDPAIRVRMVERRVESAADVAGVVAGANAVVLAADWPPHEIARWVNAACLEAHVPFVVAGQLPPLLKIGPTYIPAAGPCFTCHATALANASDAYEDYVAFRGAAPVTAPTTGPGSCLVGGLLGLDLLHLLIGRVPATAGVAILVDMRTLTMRRERIDRDPDCPACKHLDR